jgi:hypothetical protein
MEGLTGSLNRFSSTQGEVRTNHPSNSSAVGTTIAGAIRFELIGVFPDRGQRIESDSFARRLINGFETEIKILDILPGRDGKARAELNRTYMSS